MATLRSHPFISLIGLDITPLVPEAYAAYCPAIGDALAFFVNRLPDRRRQAIVREQLAMSADAPAANRLVALLHHCPTLHKLGQVVARHRSLAPAFRAQLCRLETMEPRTPIHHVRAILDRELPGPALSRVTVAADALAEASVAVVVPFTWCAQDDLEPVLGVFKVLKPGVEEALDEELAIWSELGEFLNDAIERAGLPPLDYRETFDRVRELLRQEIRLEREQHNLESAREFYAAVPQVRIPRVLPFCTPRVTAMEFLDGYKAGDDAVSSAGLARRAAAAVATALIAHPILNADERALFHADPHAGNLLITHDGHLGLIDWSLVGHLSREQRAAMIQVVAGAWTLDGARVARSIDALAEGTPDAIRLKGTVDRAVSRVAQGERLGLRWLISLLDEVVLQGGVRFDGDLLMFRKALLTLEGVMADLDPTFDVDAELYRSGLSAFARDWPMRFAFPFSSRVFSTHLSNADLADMWWLAASTGWRAWTRSAIGAT